MAQRGTVDQTFNVAAAPLMCHQDSFLEVLQHNFMTLLFIGGCLQTINTNTKHVIDVTLLGVILKYSSETLQFKEHF